MWCVGHTITGEWGCQCICSLELELSANKQCHAPCFCNGMHGPVAETKRHSCWDCCCCWNTSTKSFCSSSSSLFIHLPYVLVLSGLSTSGHKIMFLCCFNFKPTVDNSTILNLQIIQTQKDSYFVWIITHFHKWDLGQHTNLCFSETFAYIFAKLGTSKFGSFVMQGGGGGTTTETSVHFGF